MNEIKKYDIWYVDLEPIKGHEQGGKRPCIVYQTNLIEFLGVSKTYIVIPLTSQKKPHSTFFIDIVPFEKYGLSKDSLGISFQLRAVDISGFIKKIGHIDDPILRADIKQKMMNCLDREDDFLDYEGEK